MSNNVINTLLGEFCTRHSNICLFANGKLGAAATQDFVTMELPTICHDWAATPTRQSVPDFVDAYWIARCIVKHETEHTTGDPEPLAKCASCHYIIQEVPNVTLDGVSNSPFWLKLSVVVDDIKKRIRPSGDDEDNRTHESFIATRDCPFKQQHANIVRIANGELKPSDGHDYYDACDEMMALLEVWANVTFQDSPLEQYLFGENRRSSSEHFSRAADDICETYWLVTAWLTAIDNEDDEDEDDDDVAEAVATARRMCDKTRDINERLGNYIDTCYFCEYRVRVRNALKEKFKFVASVDRLHDAVYGSA